MPARATIQQSLEVAVKVEVTSWKYDVSLPLDTMQAVPGVIAYSRVDMVLAYLPCIQRVHPPAAGRAHRPMATHAVSL